jgi:mono/diheme cytochrome c family protein
VISSFSADPLGLSPGFRYFDGQPLVAPAYTHSRSLLTVRLAILTLLLAATWSLAPAALAQPDPEAVARRLLNSQGCKACHRLDGEGASFAPSLDKVGSRLSREQLRGKLANPERQHAGGRIADFSHLQHAEIDALTLFLSQKR